jgi:hypothetical protein
LQQFLLVAVAQNFRTSLMDKAKFRSGTQGKIENAVLPLLHQ